MEDNIFGKVVRRYRLRLELSQTSLARQIFIAGKKEGESFVVTPSFLSRIEKGERKPSLTYVKALATALQLTETERSFLFQLAGYASDPVPYPDYLVKLYQISLHPLIDTRVLQHIEETILALSRFAESTIEQPLRQPVSVRYRSGSRGIAARERI